MVNAKKISGSAFAALQWATHTKVALYTAFVIALANLYVILLAEDLASLLLFLCAGLAASLCTANMVLVFVSAVLAVNLAKAARGDRRGLEGFEGDAAPPSAAAAADPDDDEDDTDPYGVSKPPANDVAPGADPARIQKFKENYQELMTLQEQIMDGVNRVNAPLEKAEGLVSKMRESMQAMNL
jgi:hypothetical protein